MSKMNGNVPKNPLQYTSAKDWRVRVRLFMEPDGGLRFETSLRSRMKPAIISKHEFPYNGRGEEMSQAIRKSIQMDADRQGRLYGDSHNNALIDRMALEALKEIQAEFNQNGKTMMNMVAQTGMYEKPLITSTQGA